MITLVFDGTNNFCPIAKKYSTVNDTKSIASAAKWVVHCARAAIHESYPEGAARRIEMDALCDNLLKQITNQIKHNETA